MLLLATSLKAQHFNFDTLPKFNYQNVFSFQGRYWNAGVGVYYSRNLWSGLGYRNYEQVSIGFNFGKFNFTKYQAVPYIDYDIRIQHNIRLSLKRLLYFHINVGYAPIIPLRREYYIIYDDYINSGYMAVGLNGCIDRFTFGLDLGALVRERKQDLYYSTHTFAEFRPQFKLKFGISFGKRKE